MKRTFFSIILALLIGLTPAGLGSETAKAAPRTGTPLPLAPRFKQVRDRIADLYQHRNETPMAPDPKFNPFRAPGSLIAPVGEDPVAEVVTAPATNLALLQQAATTLKMGGTFEYDGKSHRVINGRPCKTGDRVQALVGGETIYLLVREISRRSVTLALHDAEMTLKF